MPLISMLTTKDPSASEESPGRERERERVGKLCFSLNIKSVLKRRSNMETINWRVPSQDRGREWDVHMI